MNIYEAHDLDELRILVLTLASRALTGVARYLRDSAELAQVLGKELYVTLAALQGFDHPSGRRFFSQLWRCCEPATRATAF
jgi:hypothetical protein